MIPALALAEFSVGTVGTFEAACESPCTWSANLEDVRYVIRKYAFSTLRKKHREETTCTKRVVISFKPKA